MDDVYYLLLNALPTLLMLVALVVIGVVFAPKAGPARGRLWAGLIVLMVNAALSAGWNLAWIYIVRSVEAGQSLGIVSWISSFLFTALLVLGVALLASAVVMARTPVVGYPLGDPGAPPQAGTYGGYPSTDTSPYQRPQ